jgi:hypothetical protein
MPDRTMKFLSSLRFFFWISGLLGLAMVAGTLAPQWNLFHRVWFVALLGCLALNTLACVSTRWKSIPWPSLISHLGILCILDGGAVSLMRAKSGQMLLHEDGPALNQALDKDGEAALQLPFQVKLKKFDLEYYPGGGKHEIQLVDKDGAQESLWVEPGMRYTALDGHAQLEVLEFNPDFYIDSGTRRVLRRSDQPRNPALRVALSASPRREFWVFQDYPGMHQDGQPIQVAYAYHPPAIRQFKSVVEIQDGAGRALSEHDVWVNKPLRLDGYALYQASYDPDDPGVSVISVRRDPGTSTVYLGFIILVFGLGWNAMRRMA